MMPFRSGSAAAGAHGPQPSGSSRLAKIPRRGIAGGRSVTPTLGRTARRRIAGIALGVVLGVCAGAALDFAPPVSSGVDAAPAVPVVGAYKVRVKGEGWTTRRVGSGGAAPTQRQERVNGTASVVVRPRDSQVADGVYTVEIVLDASLQASVLGASTPGKPAFRGTAALQGDWISVMDEGTQEASNAGLWVNALNLRFEKGSRRVAGSWSAIFPAREADLATQGFASGVVVTFSGRRTLKAVR